MISWGIKDAISLSEICKKDSFGLELFVLSAISFKLEKTRPNILIIFIEITRKYWLLSNIYSLLMSRAKLKIETYKNVSSTICFLVSKRQSTKYIITVFVLCATRVCIRQSTNTLSQSLYCVLHVSTNTLSQSLCCVLHVSV